MKRWMLFALLIAFLLPGCGNKADGEEELPLSGLAEAEIKADVLCHMDGEVRAYTLSCAWTAEAAVVVVEAPEALAGLVASWDGKSMQLSYQDMVLDAGSLAGRGLSPAMVLPAMAAAIQSGYPIERSREELADQDCLRVAYETEEAVYTVWFTEENVPLRCEMEQDGVLLFEVTVTSFQGAEEGNDGDARSAADLG